MLFLVENYDTYIFETCKEGKEESFFKKLNKILTNMKKNSIIFRSIDGCSDRFKDFIHNKNIILSWETENDYIGLGYLSSSDIFKTSDEDININTLNIIKQNLGYLLLPKKVLAKYKNDFISKELLDNNFKLMTDIVMSNPLTNIYTLFFKFCKQNNDLLYQSFVDYLNISKKHFPNFNSIDIIPFIKHFPANVINDCNQILFYYANSVPDLHNYNNSNNHYTFRILV